MLTLQNIFNDIREFKTVENIQDDRVNVNPENNKSIEFQNESDVISVFSIIDRIVNNSVDQLYDNFDISVNDRAESDRVLDETYVQFNIFLINQVLYQNIKLNNRQMIERLAGLYEDIDDKITNAFN